MIALGDSGRSTDTQAAVARAVAAVCAERGCDLGVILGDVLYPRGMEGPDDPAMDAVMAPLLAVELDWYVVHGNHDYGQVLDVERAGWARDWAKRTDRVDHPAPWYSLRAGPVDLWGLDSSWAFWRGAGAQRAWLDAELSASNARWKVVFGHHTLRSNGRHGNAGAYEGWVNLPFASGDSVRDLLGPAAEQADFYLSGHDHNLQLHPYRGTQLVVSGSAAGARPLVGHGNRAAFERAVPGFAWIELGQTARVIFFDAGGAALYESGAIEPRSVLYTSTSSADGQ